MSTELLRYHALLDSLEIDPAAADRLRAAADAVQRARAEGLPSGRPAEDDPALEPAAERPALEAPTVTQVSLDADPDSDADVFDGELVEPAPARQEDRA